MSLYRIKQFYWSITSKIDSEDKMLIDKYLNIYEKQLLNNLSVYEQKHSVNVARDIIKECEINKLDNETLIKAALLHDIGKAYKKLSPIEKSIFVMLNKLTDGKLRKYKRFKKIHVYYNHGDIGYNILKKANKYDERFLYLIKNHHNDFIIGDKELELLMACDSKN
jgi:putative nucleotidyltransferase with HDIG domain